MFEVLSFYIAFIYNFKLNNLFIIFQLDIVKLDTTKEIR